MIYDRTAEDVRAAAAVRKKLQSGQELSQNEIGVLERGSCTVTMLNRVEAKTAELYKRLCESAYFPAELPQTKEWVNGVYFTESEMLRLLGNIEKLRGAYYIYDDTPDVPSYLYGYKEANAAEKNLYDIERILDGMTARKRECGTFSCGEENTN